MFLRESQIDSIMFVSEPVAPVERLPAAAGVLRPVTVAAFTEDAAIVTGGINNGDKVVTLGVQKLNPGVKVRMLDTP